MKLKFQLLDKNAKIPAFSFVNDAAFNIYSNEDSVLKKKSIKGISTGIASEIPDGYFVSIEGRSGLAIKNGIGILGGIIDAGYRGEWKVILINFGDSDLKIEKGDKIAQGIVHKLEAVKITATKALTVSDRGMGGFESTGRK